MPKDAKFGLVVGLSLVIVVAVFFFPKNGPAIDPAAATIVKPAADVPTMPLTGRTSRNVEAKAMVHARSEQP